MAVGKSNCYLCLLLSTCLGQVKESWWGWLWPWNRTLGSFFAVFSFWYWKPKLTFSSNILYSNLLLWNTHLPPKECKRERLLSFCELVTTSLLAPRGLFLFRVWISDLLLGPLLGCLIYSGNPLLCCSLSATWEKAEWKAESKSFVKTLLRKKLPVSKCRQTDFITHPSCTELILSLRIIESWPKVFFGASNMKMGPISDMIHQTMAMLMIG